MKKKIALITGVTGQDGAYLSRFLLKKGYIVHGIKRRSSSLNTWRIDGIYDDPLKTKSKFFLHHGDMTDSLSLERIIKMVKPSEIYNLAAQSHVKVSFEQPEYTANTTAIGALRILECIKNFDKRIKYYQAGTSELFGVSKSKFQDENTPFYARSPYSAAKLYAHWITINYREAYNLFACNGILFNHESPMRGETFVTKKIISGLIKIKYGIEKKLILGNLYSKRDWGHAKDYVEAMWLMLQQKKPRDFVIATGKQYSVKKFIEMTCKELNINISWKGKGINIKGINEQGKIIIECNKKYFRPTEVESLLGSTKKANKYLNWKPKTPIKKLIKDIIDFEKKSLKVNG
ncbi:GDP-mannose 4,6-dehydratase [Candidatus Pelagibacter sp. HIMB1521]|uniref:GDP-mannose 4,6-dehydratase n=1 Tax=Candidatus Pelagibacter sp. HIMB1521 TaxID=3413344 RepID=UPI003F8425D9